MSASEHSLHFCQRTLPLEISARCTLVTIEFVRNLRGCDAESVFSSVANATHPKFLRWVFNVAVDATRPIRELRCWRNELEAQQAGAPFEKWCAPATAVAAILGSRSQYPRGEIEVQWTINATTISRLIRAGELVEVNRAITRASLAAFLERRLQ